MNQELYARLIELARAKKTTTYSEVAPLANLSMESPEDRDRLSQMLGDISEFEAGMGHPMLTALVIHAGGDNNPGEGFFVTAAALRRFSGSRNAERRFEFWASEVAEVYKHWDSHASNHDSD